MKGFNSCGVAGAAAAVSAMWLVCGVANVASADVWVSGHTLDKISASGRVLVSVKTAYGYELRPVAHFGNDTMEVDPRDGSVWVYDQNLAIPPPTPPEHYENVWRLLHVSRDGALLSQFSVLDGFGLAVDPGRGGIWISRPEGRVDPHRAPFGASPELLLLDPATGAIKARVHGFRYLLYDITLGADGALWVQHEGGWTRLSGTAAQLSGYDVASGPSGPLHRAIDIAVSSVSPNAVDPRDGSVWLSRQPSTYGLPPDVFKLSPDGLTVVQITPPSFRYVTDLAVHSRNGSVWLADVQFAETPTSGANVAHYSALGAELATARSWEAIYGMGFDMTDGSPWAVVAFELDSELEGPRSLVKLDARGAVRPGFEFANASGTKIVGFDTSTTEATINIAPSDAQNRIDPNSTGVVAVALLSSSGFDATRVQTDTLRFGTGGAVSRANWTRDVNGDGRLDFVHQFRVADSGVKCGDTQAAIVGKTVTGRNVHAVDKLTTINCGTT